MTQPDFRSNKHDPEGCEGCKPVVFDPVTGQPDVKLTQVVENVWSTQTNKAQRKAWHRVTCLNSRDAGDVKRAQKVVLLMQSALDRRAMH